MTISAEEMEKRVVRYSDLIPCETAFIDARTPGSDKKENFCIIGPGVAENPGQHVHVKIPHGFNIGGARQPKGYINSQHSHETEEVFLVHSGAWAFRWGHDGRDGEAVLHAGDVISIPVNVFRGFECVSAEESFLFAILGRDDPGHVTWAPYVFEQAKDYGLVLTRAGHLIDTAAGQQMPEGDEPCRPTSAEDLVAFRRMNDAEMNECVVLARDAVASEETNIAAHSTGVVEAPIIGPLSADEGVAAAKISNPHGFHFRKLVFEMNGQIPPHTRAEEEVIFVHQGEVSIYWGDKFLELKKGDTITTPKNIARSWRASANGGAVLFVVRGGNKPAAPNWLGEHSKDKTQNAAKLAS